jgi:flagellar motor switch/type III secretory pathway protein FliN
VHVPVRVVLATKKESVHDVVELAPGTIIKFAKSCDEPLNLYVGDQRVAEGEAVKVGDKFGFRVTGMTFPEEHFLKVRSGKAG